MEVGMQDFTLFSHNVQCSKDLERINIEEEFTDFLYDGSPAELDFGEPPTDFIDIWARFFRAFSTF